MSKQNVTFATTVPIDTMRTLRPYYKGTLGEIARSLLIKRAADITSQSLEHVPIKIKHLARRIYGRHVEVVMEGHPPVPSVEAETMAGWILDACRILQHWPEGSKEPGDWASMAKVLLEAES